MAKKTESSKKPAAAKMPSPKPAAAAKTPSPESELHEALHAAYLAMKDAAQNSSAAATPAGRYVPTTWGGSRTAGVRRLPTAAEEAQRELLRDRFPQYAAANIVKFRLLARKLEATAFLVMAAGPQDQAPIDRLRARLPGFSDETYSLALADAVSTLG